jgi:hypothetical protein
MSFSLKGATGSLSRPLTQCLTSHYARGAIGMGFMISFHVHPESRPHFYSPDLMPIGTLRDC